MTVSLRDQETIILWNRAEKEVEVFTYEPRLKTKLNKMVKEDKSVSCKVKNNGEGGATYIMPKTYVTIHKPRKGKPKTEEQKRAAAEVLQKAREKVSNQSCTTGTKK